MAGNLLLHWSWPELVIAIDFGITFTGIAYAFAEAGQSSTEDLMKLAKTINIAKTWSDETEANYEKTPTIIAYNETPPYWGDDVRPIDQPQVKYLSSVWSPHFNDIIYPRRATFLS